MTQRTPQQIIDQTNEIARIIYESRGYKVPDGTVFHTETPNRHPYETSCWEAACRIQELMTQTDVMDVLIELEDDALEAAAKTAKPT